MMKLSPSQAAAVQAASGCSPITISKAVRGAPMREASFNRVQRACVALGFASAAEMVWTPLPPAKSAAAPAPDHSNDPAGPPC